MTMKVGCFALIDPFATLDHQLKRISDWGFKLADVTDNTDGGAMGVEFGFASVASLDANPFDIKRLFDEYGLTIASYCAHANLLDPTASFRYGSIQVFKAVRAAGAIGVEHVITTDGDPKTEFGHNLTEDEAIFSIREKLYEPLRAAEDYGVKILIEPHGVYTDSIPYVERILEACKSDALAINLDTGNLWLGGGDPVAFVNHFGSKIEHVHWKDHGADMLAKRGQIHGTGMSIVPLGTGVVDIKATFDALVKAGFDGYTTLEVAGDDAVLQSRAYLQALGAE